MNVKIPICSYRQLRPLTSVVTVNWNQSVTANSPQPSAIYICGSRIARYRSKPTAGHKMNINQNLLLVAAIALLLLVGKYAATYTGLAGTL